jgi:hypothetical protein
MLTSCKHFIQNQKSQPSTLPCVNRNLTLPIIKLRSVAADTPRKSVHFGKITCRVSSSQTSLGSIEWIPPTDHTGA